jgi:hypothetical protein
MSGEYQSRPHAKVVREVVKFVRDERMGLDIDVGMVEALYVVKGKAGAGRGIAYAMLGQ